MLPFLKKLDRAVAWCESVLVVSLLSGLAIAAFLQILARNIWHYNAPGLDEILRHAVLWLGFFGASLATRQRRHIKIDLLSRLLTSAARQRLNLLLDFGTGAICFFLFFAALQFVLVEKEYGDVLGALNLPLWLLELVFPVVFGLCTVRYFFYTMDDLLEITWDIISRAV